MTEVLPDLRICTFNFNMWKQISITKCVWQGNKHQGKITLKIGSSSLLEEDSTKLWTNVRNKTVGSLKTWRVSRQTAEGQEKWSNFSQAFRKHFFWRYLHLCETSASDWRHKRIVLLLQSTPRVSIYARMKGVRGWKMGLTETPWEATVERLGWRWICFVLAPCVCVYKYTYIHTYICMKICTQSHWLSVNKYSQKPSIYCK